MTWETILKELERVKWFLWHGNLVRAEETLTDLNFGVDGAIDEEREAQGPARLALKKLARALEEFATYIDSHASGIVNYGERHRCADRISYCRTESRRSTTIYVRDLNVGIQVCAIRRKGTLLHSTPQTSGCSPAHGCSSAHDLRGLAVQDGD